MSADKTPDEDRLIAWVDVETTGLGEQAGSILEVGIILTDHDLTEIARWSRVVAFWGYVDEAIAAMHGPSGSGLLRQDDDARGFWYTVPAPGEYTTLVAQYTAAEWLRSHCGDTLPMWGGRNTHFDRRWLSRHMPVLHEAIFHRSIDETTARHLLKVWGGVEILKAPEGGTKHRALADLDEELRVMGEVRKALRRLR